MANKIFNIPIEAPEELAKQFINLICQAYKYDPQAIENEKARLATELLEKEVEKGVNVIPVDPIILTAKEVFQLKLNYVGLMAGKYLREVAESEAYDQQMRAKREEVLESQKGVTNLFQVLPIKVNDV